MKIVTEKKRREEQARNTWTLLLAMIFSFVAGVFAAPHVGPFAETVALSLDGVELPFLSDLLPAVSPADTNSENAP